ncbi:SUMF1/EgtB/PvdO family nonheme iron enzyme [Chlamydia sp. 17-3921]|uniref:SUMF1/EgtB/PvdO family nonheme iron enzyme n=1 Tax=Chlamydia sp. 17-3921 TaxID=2675798 RepID=UPI00191841DD|nr:SUMF1/EgtB/PvdO family nonheme iron enzyme [Chlamydia sp. 17-3921]
MEGEKDVEVEFVGDYKILRHLGRTLWSQDFFVEHRFIKKHYILKLLLPEFTSSEVFMEAFHEIIVKLATFKHRGILTIENVSQSEGQYFLVTSEREIPTLSLQQYLNSRSQPLSELEIVDFSKQLASILDYAHARGLIHGGIHLSSVHVDVSGSSPEIVLPELGFSSLLREHSLQSVLESSTNLLEEKLKQILLFLAPEQSSEKGLGDVYAFGVFVYYLLFGKVPQGVFSMPSETFPDYVYDWDSLLRACLTSSVEKRARTLTPLLVKKSLGEQLLSTISNCTQNFVREIIEEPTTIPLPEALRKETEMQKTSEALEFVLVEARSIDEVMDTSTEVNSVDLKEEEGYSQALQSLLIREPVVSRYVEQDKEETKPQPLLTDMVFIEGGIFSRGSLEGQRDEQPIHQVLLQSFFLDVHPVTNEQFIRYLDCYGEQDKNYNELIRLKDSRIQKRSGKLVIEPGYAKHPVVGVTWYGASGYAAWVGKRLPTEAEWEVAAGGGVAQHRYPCGEEIDKTQANFFSSDTTAVMSYPANAYGLYDMAGNVYEWCQDWYAYDFYEISAQELETPRGPTQGVYRVLRGGCWKSLKNDLRCAHRHRNNPGAINSTYGFRCVQEVK